MKKIVIASVLLIFAFVLFPHSSNAAEISCVLKKKSAYKSAINADVYYITENCTKQIFPNESVFFTYFTSWNRVILVDDLTLRFIPNDPEKYAPARDNSSGNNSSNGSSSGSSNSTATERAVDLILRDGSVIKSRTQGEVYVVINNKKFHIENMETLQELGIPVRWIEIVAQKTIDAIPSGTSLNVFPNSQIMSQAVPDFMLLKDKNSSAVYRAEPSSKDPKYQVLRKISNETALKKTGYRLDRLPQVTIAEIPDLSLIGVGSKTIFHTGNDLTSNSTISYRSASSDIITEKRGAKNTGAYARNEKYEGISYEYPWQYKVLRGFSYSGAFRDEYVVFFKSPNDERISLDLTLIPVSSKNSSYTTSDLEELVKTTHDNTLKTRVPNASTVRRSSTDWKRQTTYGYTRTTQLDFYNGNRERQITFIYKNQIFSGVIHYSLYSSSGVDTDLENLLYFVASTFKKNN